MADTLPTPDATVASLSSWLPIRPHIWWLTLLAAVSHVPGYVVRLKCADEASVATMAMVLTRGGELYHQISDRKPPIVPYLYASVFRLTGSTDLRPVRVLATLVAAATAVLLAAEARRRSSSDLAGLLCGVLFLLGFVAFFPDDSQAATFELFMLLPMTAAIVAAGRGQDLLAGVLLALACLCKQTAITTAAPVAYLVVRQHGPAALRHVATGFAAPIALAALWFGPRPFLLWTVTGNGGYLTGGGSLAEVALRAVGMTSALAGLELGVVVLCIVAARRHLASPDLWLWLAGGVVAVTAGFRFFGHYYLQLLPAMAIIAAPALLGFARRGRALLLVVVAAPALVCTIIGFFPTGDTRTIPYRQLAARARNSRRRARRCSCGAACPSSIGRRAASQRPASSTPGS